MDATSRLVAAVSLALALGGVGLISAEQRDGGQTTYRDVRELIDAHLAAGPHPAGLSRIEGMGAIGLLLSVIGGMGVLIYQSIMRRLESHGERLTALESSMADVRVSVEALRAEWSTETRWVRAAMIEARRINLVALEALNESRATSGLKPISFDVAS